MSITLLPAQSFTVFLPVGEQLTVTPAGGGTTHVIPIDDANLPGTPSVITSATTYGPFTIRKVYRLTCVSGSATYATGPTDLSTIYQQLNAILDLPDGAAILTRAGVPVDGTSGTGAGTAGKGSLCLDVTNGKAYVNGNTTASPTWKLITSAA